MTDHSKIGVAQEVNWSDELYHKQHSVWGHNFGGLRPPPQSGCDVAEDASTSGASWSTPDVSLLGNGRRPAPPFPIELLQEPWVDWCNRCAEAASAPVDYVAVSLLSSVGAILANVRRPFTEGGWSEPPLLWFALVGSPSAGKSPAMGAAFDLIRYAEERIAAGFEDDLQAYELAKEVAQARREAWQKEVQQAVKSGGLSPPLPMDAIAPELPVRPRIWIADVTTEKLAILAAGLPRGFLMVRDELAGWLGSFDRYGGGGSDRAFAIEMYGGRAYTVDRVKSPEPLRIPHLSIGVLGGIQPDKLSIILGGPDDGLAARFLWCWPDALPDLRLARSSVDNRAAQNALVRLTLLAMGADEFGSYSGMWVMTV